MNFTKVTTVEELKQVFVEILLNSTTKVTKISDGSVLNGTGYGVAKIGQKILKDVAIIEAHQYPDSAKGEILDQIADTRGISPRYSASGSSTYIRVVGEEGTVYTAGVNRFVGNGIEFEIDESVTIEEVGFSYVKVHSINKGSQTNVTALNINKISPSPAGHQYCINEYQASGGRDNESDDLFRKRIKDEKNILAKGTISYLEQVFRSIDPSILRVKVLGKNLVGETEIGISRVDGGDFNSVELDNLYYKMEQYLSVGELKPDGLNSYGIKIVNLPYFPIDISLRIDYDSSANVDEIRKNMQIAMNKVIDWTYWDSEFLNWLDLIDAARFTKGVKRVVDNYFHPNVDVIIPKNHLPRIRGFVLMNLAGQIIQDLPQKLNPNFYPATNDFDYQSTILRDL